MKVLIFGCGYVGKAIASSLLADNFFVGVTTRNSHKIKELSNYSNEVHFLKSPSDILEFILEYDIVIFSVAADTSNDYEEAYLKNAELILQALTASSDKKHVIYTSSTSVYGDHFGNWVDEQSELKGNSPEATILIQTEKKLLEINSLSKSSVCIYRLGEITGPEKEVKERVKRNQGLTLPGDGSNYTNFSPISDIVNGIKIAIKLRLSGIFNLCSSLHVSRKELYDQICIENNLKMIKWDANKKSIHFGNKRVSSEKFLNLKNLKS